MFSEDERKNDSFDSTNTPTQHVSIASQLYTTFSYGMFLRSILHLLWSSNFHHSYIDELFSTKDGYGTITLCKQYNIPQHKTNYDYILVMFRKNKRRNNNNVNQTNIFIFQQLNCTFFGCSWLFTIQFGILKILHTLLRCCILCDERRFLAYNPIFLQKFIMVNDVNKCTLFEFIKTKQHATEQILTQPVEKDKTTVTIVPKCLNSQPTLIRSLSHTKPIINSITVVTS